MNAYLSCLFLCPLLATPLLAGPGDLDPTFGGGTGIVTTPFGVGGSWAQDILLQKNGKFVVVGTSNDGSNGGQVNAFALARYNPDGSLDPDFGTGGKVTSSFSPLHGDSAVSSAMQSDGKIVVAGTYHPTGNGYSGMRLARYNTDGTLDTSFNLTGTTTQSRPASYDSAQAVAVLPNGKIWVLERTYLETPVESGYVLLRYTPDGILDTSFNGTGMMTLVVAPNGPDQSLDSMAIQTDGKIVFAGRFPIPGGPVIKQLKRYHANGSVDVSFGTSGLAGNGSNQPAKCILIQGDGKIVTGANSNSQTLLSRFIPDGTPDLTFNGTGTKIIPLDPAIPNGFLNVDSIAVQSDGRIISKGYSGNGSDGGVRGTTVVRCNSDGSLDTTFDNDGQVLLNLESIGAGSGLVVQPDGKIVVAGQTRSTTTTFTVARLQGDPDTDRDGLSDSYETGTGVYVSATNTGSNPALADSDADGIPDGQEARVTHTNPNLADTDGDGFDDLFEINTGFNPTSNTSTPDAVSSIRTAVEFRFNAANGISYRIESSTDLTNWTIIEPTIIGTGAVVTRFYTTENQPKRYFRPRRN